MPDFWKGPYNVLVPTECRVVPNGDGNCMSHLKGGTGVTEVFSLGGRMTEDEYHKIYCKKKSDGNWYIVYSPACEACGFKGYGSRQS